nr:hypothetical protein [uncultured Cohaesibacter sp.]
MKPQRMLKHCCIACFKQVLKFLTQEVKCIQVINFITLPVGHGLLPKSSTCAIDIAFPEPILKVFRLSFRKILFSDQTDESRRRRFLKLMNGKLFWGKLAALFTRTGSVDLDRFLALFAVCYHFVGVVTRR